MLGSQGMWAGTTEPERKRMIEFMGLVAVELDDFVPPESRDDFVKSRPKRFKKVDPNPLSDPLFGVEGPTPEELEELARYGL